MIFHIFGADFDAKALKYFFFAFISSTHFFSFVFSGKKQMHAINWLHCYTVMKIHTENSEEEFKLQNRK